ncbi:MAG: PD-(D/E)XK nuclease family protein [Chthoniobacterales bacterium]
MDATQCELFEMPKSAFGADELHADPFEWSYSRRDIFEQCLRKYYYQYFGSSTRLAKSEPQKKRLQFLKSLSNRYLRTGDILHFTIRTWLQRARDGHIWSLERLQNWARHTFCKDIDYSRGYQDGDSLVVGPRAPELLMEFYYDSENAEELCRESEAKLLTALSNFVTSDLCARFRAGGADSRALIEKPLYLREKHFAMRGKIDLAYPIGERVAVVDWKIGKSSGDDDSLQLFSYAMFVLKESRCLPDALDLYRVHLVENSVSSFKVRPREIQRATARIIQDCHRMSSLKSYGVDARAEAFTPCSQPRICCLCPFQEICPKE